MSSGRARKTGPTGDLWLRAETRPLRQRWLEPLVGWMTDAWALADRPRRLLDFGCGDGQLATLLPDTITVDGYDLSPDARSAARHTLDGRAPRGTVFDAPEQIPLAAYDGIVASSMLQYLDGPTGLADQVTRFAGWLRPGSLGVVSTDLVIDHRSVWADAADSWRFTRHDLGPVGATRELLDGARRGPRTLTTYSSADVAAAAAVSGFAAELIEPNLSPFRRRSSFAFRPLGS